MWTNVFQSGRLSADETFLVHGGTSGIGTTAIQLAKAFGATVITTAGSEEKCERCLELGASQAINYKEADFVEVVKAVTDGRGVDLTLDMVGGDYLNRNMEAAAEHGRIVQIATMSGAESTINGRLLMMKKLWLTGSTLRSRSVEQKQRIAEELESHVMPLWEAGRCLPVIDSTFAFDDVVDAHRRMDADHIGKIVLTLE